MSDTPRTDAECAAFTCQDDAMVTPDFARQLERELASVHADIDHTNQLCLDYMRERDEARECLREAIDMAQTTDDQFADRYNDIDVPAMIQRWRKAANEQGENNEQR